MTRVEVSQALAQAGCIAPDEEADELITAAADRPELLESLVARRSAGEPLVWLVGFTMFCGLRVAVDTGVYVPRKHTEPLAERASELLPKAGAAVDLCTGSGAVAAVLSARVPSASVLATELDPRAAECARRNGVDVFEGFLDVPLPKAFGHRVDVMTAVVPYVPTGAIRLLPRDVQAFEPRTALDGGPDGTDLLRDAVRRSTRWLRSGGWLLLELGGDQADSVGRFLREGGFEKPVVMTDDEGDARAICARLG